MTTFISRMPSEPHIVVRISQTSDGWQGRFVGHLGRKFPAAEPRPKPAEALEALSIKVSHLDILPVDDLWVRSLIGKLPS